jgi:hypothetical protein
VWFKLQNIWLVLLFVIVVYIVPALFDPLFQLAEVIIQRNGKRAVVDLVDVFFCTK